MSWTTAPVIPGQQVLLSNPFRRKAQLHLVVFHIRLQYTNHVVLLRFGQLSQVRLLAKKDSQDHGYKKYTLLMQTGCSVAKPDLSFRAQSVWLTFSLSPPPTLIICTCPITFQQIVLLGWWAEMGAAFHDVTLELPVILMGRHDA